MEAILQFTVTNQVIERTDEFTVVEGSDKYLQAQFNFTTPDWENMVKTGVFIDEDGTVYTSLCADDICDVPSGWLKEQKGAVGVIGHDGVTKITTRAATVRIKPKGYTGEDLEEESGAYFDQIMTAFAGSKDFVQSQAKLAERYAVGREDMPESLRDNAKYYAGRAKDIAAEIPGQVEEAKKEIDKYVSGKESEFKGDTGNVYFAAFKVVNGRLKMYSDSSVDKVRFVRAGSRLKYRLAI